MYQIEMTARLDKEFRKLDKYTQRMILAWITKNLEGCDNPKAHGKASRGNDHSEWRCRIGDYRLICLTEDRR